MYWHGVAGEDFPFLHRGSWVNAAFATKPNRALDTDDWNILKTPLPSVSLCVRFLKKLIQSFGSYKKLSFKPYESAAKWKKKRGGGGEGKGVKDQKLTENSQ